MPSVGLQAVWLAKVPATLVLNGSGPSNAPPEFAFRGCGAASGRSSILATQAASANRPSLPREAIASRHAERQRRQRLARGPVLRAGGDHFERVPVRFPILSDL